METTLTFGIELNDLSFYLITPLISLRKYIICLLESCLDKCYNYFLMITVMKIIHKKEEIYVDLSNIFHLTSRFNSIT